jgi:outer membrane autotransporter protein
MVAGMVGGYSRTSVDSGSPPGDADIDSLHFGLYGHLTEGLWYSSALVAYGYQDYDTTRRIVFGGINRTARADYDGHEFTAYIEKGLNLNWFGWRVQPLIGLQYLALNREGFQETGAGALNLTVNKDHVNSLRFSLGGRIAPEPPQGVVGAIVPEIRGRWVHEFLDDDQAISSNFAGAPGANFIVNSPELGRNFGIVGAGLNIQLGPLANLFLDYDYQFSSQLESHAGTGGLEFLW